MIAKDTFSVYFLGVLWLTEPMNRTISDQANGMILESIVSGSVAFSCQLGSFPQTADDDQRQYREAKDAGHDGDHYALRRHWNDIKWMKRLLVNWVAKFINFRPRLFLNGEVTLIPKFSFSKLLKIFLSKLSKFSFSNCKKLLPKLKNPQKKICQKIRW